jgi:hypothetical protein
VKCVARLLNFMNYLLKETMMLLMKKTVREPRAVAAVAEAIMAKTMGKKWAPTAKPTPRRLMSSAESTLVGAFSFDVVVKTCKFVDCVPFSEQLSCKI